MNIQLKADKNVFQVRTSRNGQPEPRTLTIRLLDVSKLFSPNNYTIYEIIFI